MSFPDFVDMVNCVPGRRILELGTKRSILERPTHRKDHFRGYKLYVMSDFQSGLDVDIVADIHTLSERMGEKTYDVILACSVFEHIKYPQLAAHEILKVLTMGGILFIQTHQSFPLHAYPYDYCRFSADALKALFSKSMGFETLDAWHEFRAFVHSDRDPGTKNGLAFLNSCIYGKKIKETPKEYIYEL